MTHAAAPASVRSPWFRSAPYDLLWILAVPAFTWPLVMLGQQAWGAPLLNQLILLTATGHYFATFVRAYGDERLFERFRVRFLLAPIVLLATCVGMFATGNTAPLLVVTAGWAFWHWLAQAFGFARIYDAKVGSFRPLTAWLDRAIVIAGFVGAATLNPASIATFGRVILDAGVPLPGADTFAFVQQVVLAGCIAVAIAYAGNLALTIARGQPWSWQKQVMHATTIGYYWFAFAWLPNVLVAYVLYELFHDIQYFAITWLSCGRRAERDGTAPWFRRMFRPTTAAALLFVGGMVVFGGVDVLGRNVLLADGTGHQVWLGIALTAALLHYYYDGFIWKTRESAIGADLGIQGGLRTALVPGLRHVAAWGLFFVPLAAVATAGTTFTTRERAAALVAVAPGDFLSRNDLGLELTRARELPAAIEHYRASIELNPDFAPSRLNFGAALDLQGDTAAATEQYVQALRCRDRDGVHGQAHVNLGVIALLRGDRTAARAHFEDGRRLGGSHPLGRLLGLAAAVPAGEVQRRRRLLEAALQLDPSRIDARIELGNLLLEQHEPKLAGDQFTLVLRDRPDEMPALLGMARALIALGDPNAARVHVTRALQLAPGNPEAQELRARIGG